MTEKGRASLREKIEREMARRLEEVEALRRDLAELDRLAVLAAKFNFSLTPDEEPESAQVEEEPIIEGTVAALAHAYQNDERSVFPKLAFKTRRTYNVLTNRILRDCRRQHLSEINEETIRRLYDGWTDGGSKKPIGHSLVTMLRRLVNFGRVVLQDAQCERLSLVLHNMRFETAGVRDQLLDADQITRLRAEFHSKKMPSLALAQALQFELGLSLKDIMGEWVPISEQGHMSEITWANKKWTRGLRWNQIDSNLILRHTVRRVRHQPQEVEFDLRQAPMVMEELKRLEKIPTTKEPVIIRESTDRPWFENDFRLKWREAADAAGLPKSARSSDGRPRAASTRAVRNESLAQKRR